MSWKTRFAPLRPSGRYPSSSMKLRSAEPLELLVETILPLGLVALRDEPGRGEKQGRVPSGDRFQPDGHREVRLTDAGRTHQQHVLRRADEAAPGDLGDIDGCA